MLDVGIGSWPSRRARIDPHRPALRQGERTLTYRELADRVDRLARAFASLGVGPGDRVAHLGANDIATFETFFAAGRLGAIFVPMNTRLAAAELGYLVQDSAPTVVVYRADHATTVDELRSGVTTARAWIAVHRLDELIAGAPDEPTAGADVTLDHDAVILYTSGTTGRPKGAVLTHGNLTFNTMNQLAHADVLGQDTALCISPLFHATGLGQVSLPTLFKGGCVVVLPRFDAGVVLATIARLGIASFSAVPTMLQLLCDHGDFGGTDLRSLRYVIYGGSMVAERVAVAWQRRGVPILQGYGMTEASPGVYLAPADGAVQRPVSVGVPHFFTDVRLRPVDDGGDASAGELLVRGPNVFRGYWQRPADTELALAGGWFHSGDVVRVDDDGWAYVVDRIKDLIISGGENIYPAEVEAALNELDGVLDSAVVAVPDKRWGEVGMAFIVASGTHGWTAETLRSALAGRLAAFKIPRHVRVVDDLPRTATGKVRKQDLRATAASPPSPDQEGSS
ncbi:MAG: acyl-CoA synthetase [Jatrophihabitantaceae bacterium]